jgi:hypothetical protein
MSKGYVYILTNPAMPGVVKIGRTTSTPEARAAQLYQTGVPTPFEVVHSVVSPNCQELEALAHQSLSDKRLSSAREFFECESSLAIGVLNFCLEEQLSIWLEEFLPDHTFLPCDLMVDPSDIARLSDQTGEPEPIIATALSEVTGSELVPAIRRIYDRMQRIEIESKEARE